MHKKMPWWPRLCSGPNLDSLITDLWIWQKRTKKEKQAKKKEKKEEKKEKYKEKRTGN